MLRITGIVSGNWAALASVCYLLLIVLAALFGPSLMPGDPLALSADIMLPPGSGHWLGTDDLGRDALTQLVYGTRVSLVVGGVAAVTATLLGTAVGSVAGFAGGLLDTAIMRLAEFFQVIPGFVLAVVIVTFVGPGPTRVVAVIALLAWPQTARVARGEVLRLAHAEFVDALRCIGLAEWRILLGEVIPQRARARHCGGHVDRRLCDPAGIVVEFSRTVRPQRGKLGPYAERGAAIPVHRLVAVGVPGPGHSAHRAVAQSAGRHAERCARSTPHGGARWDMTQGRASEPILRVEHLHLAYEARGRVLHAVQDASIVVAPGEAVGLAGKSGCGKSTLARAVLGLTPAGIAHIRGGRIVIAGRDVTGYHADAVGGSARQSGGDGVPGSVRAFSIR